MEEMEWGMKNALESAKSAAKNDLAKLKDLQEEAAKEAAKRAATYQKKVKSVLKDLGDSAADETEKHLEKVRASIVTWLEDAENKTDAVATFGVVCSDPNQFRATEEVTDANT